MRALVAQARAELLMTLRRGESVLLSLGIPVVLLAFFATVEVLPLPEGTSEAVDFLAPGVLALAVMSTALVGLAIATGFEREYLVLKRLGTTPLGRPRLVAAKILAVLAVEVVQVIVLAGEAMVLGWRPDTGAVGAAALAVLLATAAFSGLGLVMAGRLSGLTTLAAANGLYVVLLLLSGMLVPFESLPGPVAALARALPSGAVAEALRDALGAGQIAWGAIGVLAAWAIAAPVAAAVTFRWE